MEKLGTESIAELKKKVANLRKQCSDNDAVLKHHGLLITELPPNTQKQLDEMAQFQRKFGLYELDWSYAAELQCTLMEKQIGMKISLMEAERRKARMQKHLKQANTKLLEMENFAARIQQESKPQSDIDRLMREANHEINGFTEKNKKFEENSKFDVDRILMKLNQLENNKSNVNL